MYLHARAHTHTHTHTHIYNCILKGSSTCLQFYLLGISYNTKLTILQPLSRHCWCLLLIKFEVNVFYHTESNLWIVKVYKSSKLTCMEEPLFTNQVTISSYRLFYYISINAIPLETCEKAKAREYRESETYETLVLFHSWEAFSVGSSKGNKNAWGSLWPNTHAHSLHSLYLQGIWTTSLPLKILRLH